MSSISLEYYFVMRNQRSVSRDLWTNLQILRQSLRSLGFPCHEMIDFRHLEANSCRYISRLTMGYNDTLTSGADFSFVGEDTIHFKPALFTNKNNSILLRMTMCGVKNWKTQIHLMQRTLWGLIFTRSTYTRRFKNVYQKFTL